MKITTLAIFGGFWVLLGGYFASRPSRPTEVKVPGLFLIVLGEILIITENLIRVPGHFRTSFAAP